MRMLSIEEVLELHQLLLEQPSGSAGVRDQGGLESALAQPLMTFGGEDLYPTLVDKAAALGFSLILNHPFVDGNKRIGHAVMEVFLILNGLEIEASTDDQEQVILSVAAGEMDREDFTDWLKTHVMKRD